MKLIHRFSTSFKDKTSLVFLVLFLIVGGLYAQTVSSVSELKTALENATAGTVITIADGVYNNADLAIEATGRADAPVIIQAESQGNVIFEDNSRIKMGGSYITLTGVVFTGEYTLLDRGPDSYVISFKNETECSNCKVTQVKIDQYNTDNPIDDFRWIHIYGQYNEISYSTLSRKSNLGSMIFNQRSNGDPDYTKIHHNYFAYRYQVGTTDQYNDVDVMRIGTSTTSLSSSYTEVYDNFFFEVKGGEPEIISNKSCNNKYYNNTFSEYLGALSLRHGNDCKVFNNTFLNPGKQESYFNGGIRVIGERHAIYNNYIQGTNAQKQGSSSDSGGLGGINISAAQPDEFFELSGYGKVKDILIAHNTLVDCDYAFFIGADTGGANQTVAPDNITVVNNLIVDCERSLEEERAATNSVFKGNLYQNSGFTNREGFEVVRNALNSVPQEGYYFLSANSPAIDAAVSGYTNNLNTDVFEGVRSGNFDVGAQEYSSSIRRLPYSQEDVGTLVGFGASEDLGLDIYPKLINTHEEAFSVDLNIHLKEGTTWSIMEELDWLSISNIQGTGTATVSVDLLPNDTVNDRSGVVVIENSTGEQQILKVYQAAYNEPEPETPPRTEIPVEISGQLGTLLGKPDQVAPSFAIDGLVSSSQYWSGDAFSNNEVSMTLDLGCNHLVDALGIYFVKADQRTTNFSVLVRSDENSTFDTVFDNQSSYSDNASSSMEQVFELEVPVIARYVKIIGHGNSAGSGWSSFSEFNIYGNLECVETTEEETTEEETTEEETSEEEVSEIEISEEIIGEVDQLMTYPMPTRQVINVHSNIPLWDIELYDAFGKLFLQTYGDGEKYKVINIDKLSSGIYYLVVNKRKSLKVIIE